MGRGVKNGYEVKGVKILRVGDYEIKATRKQRVAAGIRFCKSN